MKAIQIGIEERICPFREEEYDDRRSQTLNASSGINCDRPYFLNRRDHQITKLQTIQLVILAGRFTSEIVRRLLIIYPSEPLFLLFYV